MSGSLFDGKGARKYLTARERSAFIRAACRAEGEIATFCLTLALTGARISEVLAITRERIDISNQTVVFETLKRRKRGIFREVPIPSKLIALLRQVHDLDTLGRDPNERIWKWGRTTAWKRVRALMKIAKVPTRLSTPRSARHAFGVNAVQNSVSLNVVQRWMGHARIETTTIYTDVIGSEERALARRTWRGLERDL